MEHIPEMSAEMGILRLCRVKGSRAADSLAERVSQLEKEVESLKKIISLKNAFPAPSPASAPAPAAPLEPSLARLQKSRHFLRLQQKKSRQKS